jgi:uncharacterized membrane-anchored protein
VRGQKSGIERLKCEKNKKKRLSALDKYVIFSLSALVVFTIISIVYQFISGQGMSDTLVTCFFSAFGGELLMLCLIKRLKLKKGETEDE